jgi:hypothetical protein
MSKSDLIPNTGHIVTLRSDNSYGYFSPEGKVKANLTMDQIAAHNAELARIEIEQAKATGKGILYLRRTGTSPSTFRYSVGTWDGTHGYSASISFSFHNFAGKNGRRDVWWTMDKEEWHGVNIGESDVVHAHKLKAKHATVK